VLLAIVMKSAITFALLALTNAQQDSGSDTAQSDNSYGYEAPQAQTYAAEPAAQTYAAEPAAQTYAAEPEYAAPAYAAAPKVCVVCDDSAPCWNGASCVARVAEAHSQYVSSEGGYRRLEDGTYAQEGATQGYAQGYAQPQGYASEASYEAPRMSSSCPCGSIDTRQHYQVHNKVILWVAFGLLFAPALYFFWRGHEDIKNGATNPKGWNQVRVGAGVVCMVASLAYLTMALGYGYVTKCNGRDFYYARYVDWAITTPIILYELVALADPADSGDQLMQIFLVLMDIFMIVAGLIGELVTGDEKWAFFGFSMLAFLPIMYFLTKIAEEQLSGAGCCGGGTPGPVLKLLRNLVGLTLITWIGYPIIWILATVNGSSSSCGYAAEAAQGYGRALGAASVQQVGVISVQGEAYAYTILDVLAKSVVGWLIVSHKPTCDTPPTPDCN